MSTGRQLGGAVRKWNKLHNLILHRNTTNVVSPIAIVVGSPNILDELTVPLVQDSIKIESSKVTTLAKKFSQFDLPDKQNQQEKQFTFQSKQVHDEISADVNQIIEEKISFALSNNRHDDADKLLGSTSKLSDQILTKLFTAFSDIGSIEKVAKLQAHTKAYNIDIYTQNGEYVHFLARAQCLRGNSDKGLHLLTKAYDNNVKLRRVYVSLFRDLIIDSVSNRSVASLMTFTNYVVRWSEDWNEHYPLVCLWHLCWESRWYSDQVLADQLVDAHEPLRNIIQDKVAAFMATSLLRHRDDDAAVRLLQILLKYELMGAYEVALRILFEYRLKNKDMRGCMEILKNIKVLGLALSQDLHSKYIHMVIDKDIKIHQQSSTKPIVEKLLYKF